ncbi:MAG: hypothetical protein KF777_18005 [Planctomycetaceae bacterium]|nr:hypothetical protein [Planctomycetaceae bacterium]
MIQPEDIRRKASNLYPAFQFAWLDNGAFFPKVIPCDKTVDSNLAVAIESIHRLRSESKEQLGYGYAIEWEERNSRTHGRNGFPRKISFETPQDLLKLIGKEREFTQFTVAVDRIRARYPQLAQWIRSHRRDVIDAASELDGLLQVVDYLVAHPRPDRFARELPLPVDTKFIERNRRILRAWLDLLLPPHVIRADEEHFDRRFGLRYVEPLVFMRCLDEAVQQQANWPWGECALPLHSLAALPLIVERVLIVENKVNLLTLPRISGAIAMGGLGNGVTDLRYVTWLSQVPVWYWGDLDVDGFEILSRLRTVLPHTKSLLMNENVLLAWRASIGTTGNGRVGIALPNLTPEESQAFQVCSVNNLRIEQERIPQAFVLKQLNEMVGTAAAIEDATKSNDTAIHLWPL